MDTVPETFVNDNAPKHVDASPVLRENGVLDTHENFPSSSPVSPRFPPTRSQTANSSRLSYAESAHIKSLKEGHSETWNSLNSTGSSDPKWVLRQNILCLDGGGIRGYSTLLILDRLMGKIKEIEESHNDPAHSSFHPHKPQFLDSVPSDEPVEMNSKRRTTWRSKGQKPPVAASKPDESFYPCHYFDYMFGTSTGGLIAILLGRLRLTVKEALNIYEELAGDVFGKPHHFSIRGPLPGFRPKYDHEVLEGAIKLAIDRHSKQATNRLVHQVAGNVFNPDPTFTSEPLMCRTVCIAYLSQGKSKNDPFLFRSYEHAPSGRDWERNPGPGHAIPIWKVGRATSAAPSYFEPMEIDDHDFLDGGMGCNNPSWEAYQEVKIMQNQSEDSISLLLSVGTGVSEYDLGGGKGWTKKLQTLRVLPKVVADARSQHQMMQQLEDSDKVPYVRFNVPKELGSLKLDTWRTKGPPTGVRGRLETLSKKITGNGTTQSSNTDCTLENMLKRHRNTPEYIKEHTDRYLNEPGTKAELERIAQKLVDVRRDRTKTARWELFALGSRYRCILKGCPSAHRYKDSVNALRKHIVTRHVKLGPGAKLSQEQEKEIADLVERGRLYRAFTGSRAP